MTLTVEENLQLGAMTRRDRAGIAADIERVYAHFPRLKERRAQQAGTLSGGEQQMLAVGRALMLRPRLMLLDEPSFGLAPLIVEELFAILRRVNRETGVAMLIVEQNAALALDMAEHAYLLETGRIVMDAPAAVIGADEVDPPGVSGVLTMRIGGTHAVGMATEGRGWNCFCNRSWRGWRPGRSMRRWRWRW